jgi:hypothetical protein
VGKGWGVDKEMLAALLLTATLASSPAGDPALRDALEVVYDGATDGGLARLEALAAASPRDPLPAYFSALALCWRIEQDAESTALDRELTRRADAAIALADARLRENPRDARALLARAGGWGAKGRLQLLRRDKRESARSAVRMRRDLLALQTLQPDNLEARFGLGLYDYYADVLPRLLRLLGFLAGIPGGDRERGLARIEDAKRAALHDTEARAQLYEIYAFYEKQPDRAHEEILELRRLHPGSPLWALKLAEHERERMGLYAESAAVAREILAATERGDPNHAPVVGMLARLALAESLLLDLRLAEARQVLLAAREASAEFPRLALRARLLLGRSLELEGDLDGARAHYRLAAEGSDPQIAGEAERALDKPSPAQTARALHHVAEARRLRETRRFRESADAYRRALAVAPDNAEAALGVAEDDLERGLLEPAREALETLGEFHAPDAPWLRPWSWLLRARAHDLGGARADAVKAYKRVLQAPLGRDELRRAASAGLEEPYATHALRRRGAAPDQ